MSCRTILREGMPLADPAGDQLDVLRAEVEDQDGASDGVGAFHEQAGPPWQRVDGSKAHSTPGGPAIEGRAADHLSP